MTLSSEENAMPRTLKAPRTTTVELTASDMLTIIKSLADDCTRKRMPMSGESLAISGKLLRARREARGRQVGPRPKGSPFRRDHEDEAVTDPFSPTPGGVTRPARPAPAVAPGDPIIFPSPCVARRVARLVAKLHGADARRVLGSEEIDAICDTHRLGESDRGVLMLREAIDWLAVTRHLCGSRGWTPDRVRSLSPSGLLAALEADSPGSGEGTTPAGAASTDALA
jgi:hypothetical protein